MAGDPGLERLLDFDGFLAEIGGGYWVKIEVRSVPADEARPHGIVYSLTLHSPNGTRVIGIDNAHSVRPTHGPAGRSQARLDHLHRGGTVRPYDYRGANALLDDFWGEVSAILRKEGIE